MSFYGQILYEFTKLFTKINISNNNTETVTSTALGSQPSLVAADRWDQVNIKGGNHWIRLTSDANNKDLTIAHSGPGSVDNDRTVISFKPLTADEVAALPEDTVITPLYAEQCFQTTKSEYDKAGHSVSAQTEYFYLPVSTTEHDLSTIKEKHFAVPSDDEQEYDIDAENMGISINDYLSKNEYLQKKYLDTALGEYLKTYHYVTTDLTGEKATIYPNMKEEERPSLAEAIGPLDNSADGVSKNLNVLLYGDDTYKTQLYSISQILNALINEIKKLNEGVAGQQSAYYALLTTAGALEQRIATLEAIVNPTPPASE